MTIAQGIKKKVIIKKQSGLGSPATGSGGQDLRRVSCNLALTKETFQSNEIRTDQQISDMRHGSKQVGGSLNGELSPKTYQDLFAAVLRKSFASAFTAITGLTLTIAASGSLFTVTRGSGSFISDGVKVGHVASITAGSVATANLNNRFVVVSLTATELTVKPIGATALVADTGITSCTITASGLASYVPSTGHTSDYFSIEQYYSDLAQSELFTDVKPTNASVTIPANAMATVDFPLVGLNMTTNTSQQITSTNVITTTGVAAGTTGALILGGTASAVITSINFDINGNVAVADAVVGSTTRPDVFDGSVVVTGSFTAHFDSVTYRDLFINETEASLVVVLATTPAKNTDFVAFTLPRVKLSSADPSDAQTGLTRTFNFTAIKHEGVLNGTADTTCQQTTVMIQDSQAA